MVARKTAWLIIILSLTFFFYQPQTNRHNHLVYAGGAAKVSGPIDENENEIVAIVAGKEIREKELQERIQGQMLKLRDQIYNVKVKGLEVIIAQHLLEEEARARNLTKEELLQQEVDSKVGEVTPEEIEEYYKKYEKRIKKPLEEVRGPIFQSLKKGKIREARTAYLKTLRDRAKVKILLKPPLIKVSSGDSPFRGPENAPITIIEFSEYQCPFCARVQSELQKVLTTYGDKVKLVYRDFPLKIHKDAQRAAEAAHCAGEQGKYWDYHDKLYANIRKLDVASLKKYAQELQLDSQRFDKCLEERKYKSKVEKNVLDGTKAGVTGTPAFFINGRYLSGAKPFSAFKTIIDAELASIAGE